MATAGVDRCRTLLRSGVCAAVVLAPLPFGAVQPWAVLALEILAAVLGLGAVWVVFRDPEAVPDGTRIVALPALALLSLGILQLMPAPAGVVRWLARPTAEARAAVARVLPEAASSAAPASLSPPDTLDALLRGISYALIALATLIAFRKRRHFRAIGIVIVASASFQALYGTAEYVSQHQHIFAYAKKYYLDCATGTFINRNHFATYLAMGLPFALGVLADGGGGLLSGRSWRERLLRLTEPSSLAVVFAGLAAFLIWIGVFLSYSRGGLAAALVATVVLALQSGMPKRRMWILVAVCLLPAVFLSWQQLRAPGERFLESGDALVTGNQRLPVWKAGGRMVPPYAVLGVGWGTFENAFQMHQPASRVRWQHVHNDWLQLVIEGGVPALVLGSWILWLAMTAARRGGRPPDPLRKCLVAAIAAVAFHSLLDFPLRIPAVAVLLACLLGLLFAREAYDADVRPLVR